MSTESIQKLESKLPPIKIFTPRCELDYYGFSQHLSQKLNLRRTPFPLIADWKHGWLPSYSLKYVEQIAQGGDKKDHVVVSTMLQKQILQRNGFSHVTVGGLPYCYIPKLANEKIQNSLLIIPCHTLKHVGFSSDLKLFFENASTIAKDFEHVAVLEHQDSDFSLYKKEFPQLYFIKGASALDKNSLLRMKMIFSSFENIITNGIGSHLIYANIEYCKTSIITPYYHQSSESLINHPWYQKNSHLLEQHEIYNELNTKKNLPFLFTPIQIQKNYYKWAIDESGALEVMDNKLLIRTLGWTGIKMLSRFFLYPKSLIKNLINYKQLHDD